MPFYVDEELQGNERAMVDAHLNDCAACRELFAAEQQFLGMVRASRPLFSAPPELCAKIAALMSDVPAGSAVPPALRRRVRTILRLSSGEGSFILRKTSWVPVTLVIVFSVAFAFWTIALNSLSQGSPAAFALMAVDAHQRHLRDQLPLEIRSKAPREVSAWFSGKVPFQVELPNYQEMSGQEKLYDINGARLVGYENDYAAYVAYEMRGKLISLVITSAEIAEPSGGEVIVSKGIPFHHNAIGELKVITWSHRGLTYALVSDLEERGQLSCLVCHQGTTDREFLQSLKRN
jgi:anti-sigma factor RsiW